LTQPLGAAARSTPRCRLPLSSTTDKTTTLQLSGGPLEWEGDTTDNEKVYVYYRIKCSDAAQGTLERIGDKYYQVSP
jgi:hypothetical protein